MSDGAFQEEPSSDVTEYAPIAKAHVTEYAPIAKVLSTLDASSEQRLKRTFEIAYLLCKQNLAFLNNMYMYACFKVKF